VIFIEAMNLPIQTFCICSTFGEFTPLRFRFEDSEHTVQTINIEKVLYVKEINYVGREAYVYTCKAVIDDMARLFEIKYTVGSHKWTFYRMLD